MNFAERLHTCGQGHLLHGLDDLEPASKEAFLKRLQEVDWEELSQPVDRNISGTVASSRVVDGDERAERDDEFTKIGEAAYAQGKVAIMVAGGMGSRLGFSGPRAALKLVLIQGNRCIKFRPKKYAMPVAVPATPFPF